MTSVDHFRRVDELFRAAVRLPTNDRTSFLCDRCASDQELLADVVALLKEDAANGTRGPLDQPALGGAVNFDELTETDGLEAPLPRSIGRYRIIRLIGVGGMGAVYEAEQDQPRRRVALKVIRGGVVTPSLLRRFKQEAHVLGQLTHPGIAPIYEAGTADDGQGSQPYFAMELVHGRPLMDFASAGSLGTRQRLELIALICDAVHHAHQHGVIHRDLKPANILVDHAGHPRILDFGVARLTDADTQTVTMYTDVGQLVGTVSYMSPEQAAPSADSSGIDARSDVYALGVITFELLAGRLPYDVGGKLIHDAVRVICQSEPSRLSSINRVFRGDVETIVSKALEKDASRRYASAADLAADIRRYLNQQPIIARPASALYQFRKFARRNKALVGGAAVASAGLLMATGVSVWQARAALHAKNIADEEKLAAVEQATRATIASATIALDQHDPLTSRRMLDSIAVDRRNWEWHYAASRIDTSVALIEAQDPILAATLAEDSALVVTVTNAGIIEKHDPFLTTPISQISVGESLGAAAVSADGAWVAGSCGSKHEFLAVWDAGSGRELDRIGPLDDELITVAISADGVRAAAGAKRHVFMWMPGAPASPVLSPSLPNVVAISFSEDGLRLAAGYNTRKSNNQDGWFCIFDAVSGKPLGSGQRYTIFTIQGIALDGDGSRVAVGHNDKRLCVHDVKARQLLRAFTGHQSAVRAVALDAAGRRLAAASDDGTVRMWDVDSGEQIAAFTGHDGGATRVMFSHDGHQLLAVAGRTVRIWSFDADDSLDVLRGHESFVYGVAFADKQRIISSAWDGTLRAWNVQTREPLATWKPPLGIAYGIAVCPAAGLLATAHQGLVSLWDADTYTHRMDLDPQIPLRMASVSLSADGSRVAARCASHVIVWDAITGREIVRHNVSSGNDYCAVALSPDGRSVAVDGSRGQIVILGVDNTTEKRIFAGHTRAVCTLLFNRDGTLLASGSRDATARLWDVRTGTEIHQLVGHADNVYALAFSPDETRLATGSNDTTVRLWDTKSGDRVALLSGHGDYVFALAFSPDGSILVSGSGDHTLHLWDTQPLYERWRARALSQRE